MKKLIMLACMVTSFVYAWSETNVSQLQERVQFRNRTKLEEEVRAKLRERLQTEECDEVCERLFARIREGANSQKQYEQTLSFVKAYMDKNRKSFDPEDLIEAGEFYQKNTSKFEGTTREKRNALMIEAEKIVRNRERMNSSDKELLQKKAREEEQYKYSYSYQNRVRQGNISENPEKKRMMEEKKEEQSFKGRR